MISATAKSTENRSDSILVSFDSRWEKYFIEDRISVIFRKRMPKITPMVLYVYIGSPKSRVIGRAFVNKIGNVKLERALSLAQKGCITDTEIRSYVGSQTDIGVYFIDSFELAPTPPRLSKIREHARFYPPQSFVILSARFKELLNSLCSFDEESQ